MLTFIILFIRSSSVHHPKFPPPSAAAAAAAAGIYRRRRDGVTGVSRHGRWLRHQRAGPVMPHPVPPAPSPGSASGGPSDARRDTVLAVIQLSARMCEYSCTRHGPHFAPMALGGKPLSILHRLSPTPAGKGTQPFHTCMRVPWHVES
jgi:hypothetical protein